MLAIERVFDRVERLGAGGCHDVAHQPTSRLLRLARGRHVRRRRGRVFLGVLAQVLAIDERVVEFALAQAGDHLRKVLVHGLVGEQSPVQLALHVLRERGPVAAHDFHADEFHAVDLARHA